MSQYIIQDTTLAALGTAVKGKMGNGVAIDYPIASTTLTKTVYYSDTDNITNEVAALFPNLTPSYYKLALVTGSDYGCYINGTSYGVGDDIPVIAQGNNITIRSVRNDGYSHTAVLKVTFLDSDQNPMEYSEGTETATKIYASTDSLPVSKLADIISNLPSGGGGTVNIVPMERLFMAGEGQYASDSSIDAMSYHSYYQKPSGLVSVDQLKLIVWNDNSGYLYWACPAADIDSSDHYPIYRRHLGGGNSQDTLSTYGVFKANSSYYWVNSYNTISDTAGIVVYTS